MRRSDDLPQPLGPRSATNSPSATVRLTLANAVTVEKSLWYTCSTSRISIFVASVMDLATPATGADYIMATDWDKAHMFAAASGAAARLAVLPMSRIDSDRSKRSTDRCLADGGTKGLMGSIRNRDEIEEEQSKRLRRMLQAVLPANEFYRKKLLQKGLTDAESLDELAQLPFTTKGELVKISLAYPPYGTDLTFPVGTLHPHPPDLGHHRKADVLARHRRVVEMVGGLLEGHLGSGRRSARAIAFFLRFRLVHLSVFGPVGRERESSAPWRFPAAHSPRRSG